jgi:nucleoside-diphosphate-sugar epimerase
MKALVTGGGGFLGSNLVKALRARGDEVRVLARGDYPELRALGVETVRGDIVDAAATAKACEGMTVVFHTAAKAGGWGDPKEYEAINITGTDHVIAGAKAAKVPVLVHTSSPSIVHGHADIEGANESIPYAAHFTADYPRTKAISEQHALAASLSPSALATRGGELCLRARPRSSLLPRLPEVSVRVRRQPSCATAPSSRSF